MTKETHSDALLFSPRVYQGKPHWAMFPFENLWLSPVQSQDQPYSARREEEPLKTM